MLTSYVQRASSPSIASRAQSTLFRKTTNETLPDETLPDETLIKNAATSATTTEDSDPDEHHPRSLAALHLKPLRRDANYGIPSCDLQIRSYSRQPLDFYADFALRAAYYLGLPAYGPTPLPRITQRWTVPRSHFIFKKSQENFERRTYRRLIQIKDGNPETVQLWLAYLRKNQFFGIGMKANMWEFSELGVAKDMEALEKDEQQLESAFSHLGRVKDIGTQEKVEQLLASRKFKSATGMAEPPSRVHEFFNPAD